MEYKIEQGLRATLVVTPVDSVKSEVYDGLSAIRDYLDGLETPPLGSKENPFRDTVALATDLDYSTLHPRVLNDYSLPEDFRNAAAAIFKGAYQYYNTGVSVKGPVEELVVQDPKKGTYHIEQRVAVKTSYWPGGKQLEVKVKVRDLMGREVGYEKEQKLYRVWKDAQLKEAKNLTRKRIMKTLAGSADAPFKFGDRLKVKDGRYPDSEVIFIGYFRGGSVILLENGTVVHGSATSYVKA